MNSRCLDHKIEPDWHQTLSDNRLDFKISWKCNVAANLHPNSMLDIKGNGCFGSNFLNLLYDHLKKNIFDIVFIIIFDAYINLLLRSQDKGE